MSDTDSFIDEVNDEVRRDRLFELLRRYGWVAGLVVALIVGGAAFSEYRKAQIRAQAEALGDAMLAAVSSDDAQARAAALADIDAANPTAGAVLAMLTAAEQVEAGAMEAAVATLNTVATDAEVPAMYRQIATFKALTMQADTLPAAERRQQFEALAQAGSPLRLLSEEQLALIDISAGDRDAAIARLQSILNDAEVSADLQQRALQVIVALGGAPELDAMPDPVN
ncbi:hypothetical protein [Sulfitobacter sabulilitoris]|uniref:Tetratricopeptide repeat protein n=1 Tax=Sulfitobacter sabulilitoris TaxID=2562655 RepID=A0A5S3PIN5_9RHOB|nr:hypothetical protein [Sulfitobacter sabulilitoris]TMM54254.1 hypothetical protein FDT80_01250 [Sulfitobacter sabulilitoris]